MIHMSVPFNNIMFLYDTDVSVIYKIMFLYDTHVSAILSNQYLGIE